MLARSRGRVHFEEFCLSHNVGDPFAGRADRRHQDGEIASRMRHFLLLLEDVVREGGKVGLGFHYVSVTGWFVRITRESNCQIPFVHKIVNCMSVYQMKL